MKTMKTVKLSNFTVSNVKRMTGMKKMLGVYMISSILFNVLSFVSLVCVEGKALTKNDPLVSTIGLGFAFAALNVLRRSEYSNTPICVLFACVLAKNGVFEHVMYHEKYLESDLYYDHTWIIAALLNAFGIYALLVRIRTYRVYAISVFIGILAILMFRGNKTTGMCSDVPTFFNEGAYSYPDGDSWPNLPHLPYLRKSQYIEMSDGVKLAVDIYLPRDHNERKRPTFLHFTRYQRNLKRSMLSRFITIFDQPPQPTFNLRSLRYIEHFVSDGYAFVTVDTRGAGASQGNKPVDMLPREVLDLKEISSWVLRQSFCDGNIASGGISYDGIMAAAAAMQGNIKAIGLIGFYGDIYRDIAMVGGLSTKGFIDSYAAFTSASERNEPVSDAQIRGELPWIALLMQELLFDGVAKVDTDKNSVIMRDAIKEHQDNYDMRQKSRQESISCRDDSVATHDGKDYVWNDISDPERTVQSLLYHNVSVSTWAGTWCSSLSKLLTSTTTTTGYYDAGSCRASIRLHNDIVRKGGRSRLVVGPWSHGNRKCFTPSSGKDFTTPSYPLHYDLKRFVDCELRGKGCEASSDLSAGSLHYFLTGPDKFQSTSGAFPPPDTVEWRDLWIGQDEELHFEKPQHSNNAYVDFDVDPKATTGLVSRWNLVQHLMKRPVTYEEMYTKDTRSFSLTFESSKLERSMRMIGSALVEFQFEILDDGYDATIFAYLEDVDSETGKVVYVTEGQVRASHHHVVEADSVVGSIDSVVRSYRRKDLHKLGSGSSTLISFSLEPIAYEFPKGHSVRLRFTGADAQNFYIESIDGRSKSWRVYHDQTRIRLPVSE